MASSTLTSSAPQSTQLTVLLTGSTGNLGIHLLQRLLSDINIKHIYCLNRSSNARDRQYRAHTHRGFPIPPHGRITFIKAEFSAPLLGLAQDIYDKLRTEVDIIIHNAWPVDFNRAFQSFSPSIEGVKNLVAFASLVHPPSASATGALGSLIKPRISPSSTNQTSLLFISSIGVASAWSSSTRTSQFTIPEAELTDWDIAHTGYGQSKLVSERIIAHASRTMGISTSIVRVGQLAGPVSNPSRSRSSWPAQEWLPSMILSCKGLGAMPRDLGPAEDVAWVPVDSCATVINELVHELLARQSTSLSSRKQVNGVSKFFHITNPQSVSYKSLLPTLWSYFPPSTRIVPFTHWVSLLRKRKTDVRDLPAVKLLDWFENLQNTMIRFPDARSPVFDTKRALRVCETLRALEGVTPEWINIWMEQWGFKR